MPSFLEISDVRPDFSSIYLDLSAYIAGIILISLLTFLLTLVVFRRKTLNVTIRSGNKKLFRKVSIAVQLIVSIGFSFCTIVMVKQMYHLHNTDLGFSFKNRGYINFFNDIDMDVFCNKIQQIPDITEIVKGHMSLVPRNQNYSNIINKWDDKPENAKPVNIDITHMSEQYFTHYELEMLEGEMLNDDDDENLVIINESAAKTFGWNSAVGKSFGKYRVKGVIKNIYNSSPTISVIPCCYIRTAVLEKIFGGNISCILFKFREGTWKTCRAKIEEMFKKEYPQSGIGIYNTENEYDKYLKSENTLLKILALISSICVIVCVFGFVSMVSLTCEERRKEIAIRKINGATIKDILDIFFKEYLTLLAVGALIAFPVGYIIMKRWLESYVVQTEMNAWIYLSILLALIMAIVMCVGGKVYGTSRENPINAIK